ncbi:MAG: hypothetical protein BalsKO_27420 [Balneolaceae bacterium]
MKRVALLSLILSITSIAVFAQTEAKKAVDYQYKTTAQKSFLYQVSPEMKASDDWVLAFFKNQEAEKREKQRAFTELSSDTTWSYSDYIALGDTVAVPVSYSHYFINGSTASRHTYFNNYTWGLDSSKWYPSRLQATFLDSLEDDSSTTLFYNQGSAEPYTGSKYIYPQNPKENADYESFYSFYVPGSGWQKNENRLSYRNEEGRDTLSKTLQYNPELEEYRLISIRRNQASENYSFNEYESYTNGVLNSIDTEEQTSEYFSSERTYFDSDTITYAEKSYIKLGPDFRYIYQVSKLYDIPNKKFIGQDSLHFTYAEDESKTEAEGFTWNDSVWVLSQAYTSFQSLLNEKYVSDSVVIYEVVTNLETMLQEIGRVQLKTEMDYDINGNQIEVRNYSIIDDSLQMNSKIVRMFRAFGDSPENTYYRQVKQESYRRDFVTGELYRGNISENFYDANGSNRGSSYFNLSALGDTTYGYLSQYEVFDDFSSVTVRFEWDFNLKELVLKNYRLNNFKTTNSEGQKFNQNQFVDIVNGEQAVTRTMNVYTADYPGIFNDGPIYAEMGDTLIYHISARHADMTIPEIEVTNMPASATFNPETRRFFWIVDEENPSPMMYKAIRGDKFMTTEVEFINEQFAVGTEEQENPNTFKLSQNYPNPFNPSTNISFELPSSGEVDLKVYNLLGQEVATLVNHRMNSGSHTIKFDASRLASGVYIYRLMSGGLTQAKKMMLIK